MASGCLPSAFFKICALRAVLGFRVSSIGKRLSFLPLSPHIVAQVQAASHRACAAAHCPAVMSFLLLQEDAMLLAIGIFDLYISSCWGCATADQLHGERLLASNYLQDQPTRMCASQQATLQTSVSLQDMGAVLSLPLSQSLTSSEFHMH